MNFLKLLDVKSVLYVTLRTCPNISAAADIS